MFSCFQYLHKTNRREAKVLSTSEISIKVRFLAWWWRLGYMWNSSVMGQRSRSPCRKTWFSRIFCIVYLIFDLESKISRLKIEGHIDQSQRSGQGSETWFSRMLCYVQCTVRPACQADGLATTWSCSFSAHPFKITAAKVNYI